MVVKHIVIPYFGNRITFNPVSTLCLERAIPHLRMVGATEVANYTFSTQTKISLVLRNYAEIIRRSTPPPELLKGDTRNVLVHSTNNVR